MGIRTMLFAGILNLAALALPSPVSAHHSAVAQFDLDKPLTLKGTLTKLEWVNPHAWIYVTVKSADGKTEDWRVEAGSPLRMEKRGLKRDYFRPGLKSSSAGFAPGTEARHWPAGSSISLIARKLDRKLRLRSADDRVSD